jgi:hypothetical protein
MLRKCVAFVASVCGQLPGAITGALVTLWWERRRLHGSRTADNHFDLTAHALQRSERYRRERDKTTE